MKILLKFIHFINSGTNADFEMNFTKSLAGAREKSLYKEQELVPLLVLVVTCTTNLVVLQR